MNCHTLSLRAGQTGRLRFSISPEGDYALAGAVHAQGADMPLEADGDDLLIPALPVGLHLVEVRANGRTVLYGGLEVLPSPLEGAPGEACWSIGADLAESVASISVSLAEGLPGPQGEPGPPGEPGEDGASAYEAWLAAGHSGSEADFLAALRPSPDEVAQAAEGALYELVPVERSTPEGTANATCQYMELDAQHVPPGRLASISLRCRSGNNPSTYSYLAVWELGEDGETWSYLASSTNNPGQAMNTTKAWLFGEGVFLSGRPLRILAQAERSDAWAPGPELGVRTGVVPEGDATMLYRNGKGFAFLPELSIAVQQQQGRFAPLAHAADAAAHVTAAEREAWNAKADAADVGSATAGIAQQLSVHASNTTAHVYAAEHALLAGLREGTQAGAVPVLYVKGTQGNNLLAVRGNETNVSVSGSQLSLNVPRLTMMSDCPALYRYDAATGASEVWLAGAPDAERLAPLGITEAGTHVGAPSLPLCLRGSELRFNGEPLDDALQHRGTGSSSVAVGHSVSAAGEFSVAIGAYNSADLGNDIAIGHYACASGGASIAIGLDANAMGNNSVAIGHYASVRDSGCVVLAALGKPGYAATQLFLIPAGSELSVNYLDGEAGLGYVVHSSSNSLDYGISQAGCRKLSELLTDHASDFTPTGFHW